MVNKHEHVKSTVVASCHLLWHLKSKRSMKCEFMLASDQGNSLSVLAMTCLYTFST